MKLENCAKLFLPFRGGRLFVGFSGGADSTALLLLAHDYQPRFGYELTAIHFDHGLRPESAMEADGARQFAETRGIPFRCVCLELEPGANLEARAREARLEYWRELAANRPRTAVLLGHHRDDRMENLLLRLGRGSNVSGVTSLRMDATVNQIRILRPLLSCSRSEIEQFLASRNIFDWQRDSSNDTDEYERNYLRNQLLREWISRNPAIRSGLQRSLDVLELDARYLEKEARRMFLEIAGNAETPLAFWQALDPALLPRVLRHYLSTQFPREIIPGAGILEQLTHALQTRSPEKRLISLGNSDFLELRGEFLKPFRPQPLSPDIHWQWRRENKIEWAGFRLQAFEISALPPPRPDIACFDADLLAGTLLIGARRTGDKMVPFGRSSQVSLKKLRIDRKLPAEFHAPVLRMESNGPILWAPGIRHGAVAAITPATRHIVMFKCSGVEIPCRTAPQPPVPAPRGNSDAQY